MAIWCKPGNAQPADQSANVEAPVDSSEVQTQSAYVENSKTLDANGAVDIDDARAQTDTEETSLDKGKKPSSAQSKAKRERLAYIQDVISQKIAERSQLGTRIEAANEQDRDDLRAQANALTTDLVRLRKTLGSLAINGIDDSLFVQREVAEESNWREDVALIAEPVIDSLKEITEKPRRLNELNDLIVLQEQKRAIANEALQNLQSQLEIDSQDVLARSLIGIAQTWRKRRDEATNQIEIANIQIASLQGNKSLPQAIWEGLVRFAKGRGLTILMAAGAAVSVWLGIRFLMRGYRRRLLESREPESRTRYRLAAYSVHLLTLLSILIAIFVVFYERGDVLLLGLLILLIVGLALSIRNLLPQYLREARLLLNIGPMRQAERIHYRGLPWRVESINMYTVLRNPELHGILRIPLSELHGVNSRPAGNDHWFPSSRGDIVLLDEDTLVEVRKPPYPVPISMHCT